MKKKNPIGNMPICAYCPTQMIYIGWFWLAYKVVIKQIDNN